MMFQIAESFRVRAAEGRGNLKFTQTESDRFSTKFATAADGPQRDLWDLHKLLAPPRRRDASSQWDEAAHREASKLWKRAQEAERALRRTAGGHSQTTEGVVPRARPLPAPEPRHAFQAGAAATWVFITEDCIRVGQLSTLLRYSLVTWVTNSK